MWWFQWSVARFAVISFLLHTRLLGNVSGPSDFVHFCDLHLILCLLWFMHTYVWHFTGGCWSQRIEPGFNRAACCWRSASCFPNRQLRAFRVCSEEPTSKEEEAGFQKEAQAREAQARSPCPWRIKAILASVVPRSKRFLFGYQISSPLRVFSSFTSLMRIIFSPVWFHMESVDYCFGLSGFAFIHTFCYSCRGSPIIFATIFHLWYII